MKRWRTGVLAAAAAVLVPQTASAQEGILPVRQVLMGAERVQAYWVLGACSALFVVLIFVWSVRLKRASQQATPMPRLPHRVRK